MSRLAAALAALILAAGPAAACTFCGGDFRTRQTLRLQYAAAKVVLFGHLKDPRFDPKTDDGFTDLHVASALKDDPARGTQAVVTIPKYLPVIGNTPADFLLFCGTANGKLDPTFGVPASPAVVDYLKAAARLDDADPAAKLAFYFKHLDAADRTVAEDAFLEFARASDAEILKAARAFDPAKVRKLIADPNTPPERVGVFAFLLGVSGGPADAAFLHGLLAGKPLSERAAGAYGGLLAGYVLLAPKDGWALAARTLGDEEQAYSVRLAAIGTVRFFQATRGGESKPDVLRCCAVLLPQADLADLAVEDLRRWGYWDLTADVLAQFPKPTHSAPIVRRAIVRYALCCPDEAARRFVAAVCQTDPKLVKAVEDTLNLYAPVNPPKKNP